MTEAVRELLDAFDALPDAERHEVAAELLRRILRREPGDLSDDALIAVAEELFLELDTRESADG